MDDMPEHAQRIGGNYPALYASWMQHEQIEVVDFPVFEGVTPASLDECSGWLITGSRFSVYDDVDWIRTAADIVRTAVAQERPLVGECFGHQLFAHALGGRTSKSDSGWGVGAVEYETVRKLPWFPEADESITLVASHQDQVVELPPDATVWSRTDHCPIAGMLIGDRAWSFQGHPEFTAELAHVLYAGRVERLGADVVATAQNSLGRPLSNRAIATAITRFIRG